MKKKQIIIVTIVLVLILGLYAFFSSAGKNGQANKILPTTTLLVKASVDPAKAIKQAVKQKKTKLADPFSLRVSVRRKDGTGQEEELENVTLAPSLEGIWVSRGTRVAFISGQAVNVGGTVLGWRVVGITQNQVVIKRGNESKILKLEVD